MHASLRKRCIFRDLHAPSNLLRKPHIWVEGQSIQPRAAVATVQHCCELLVDYFDYIISSCRRLAVAFPSGFILLTTERLLEI